MPGLKNATMIAPDKVAKRMAKDISLLKKERDTLYGQVSVVKKQKQLTKDVLKLTKEKKRLIKEMEHYTHDTMSALEAEQRRSSEAFLEARAACNKEYKVLVGKNKEQEERLVSLMRNVGEAREVLATYKAGIVAEQVAAENKTKKADTKLKEINELAAEAKAIEKIIDRKVKLVEEKGRVNASTEDYLAVKLEDATSKTGEADRYCASRLAEIEAREKTVDRRLQDKESAVDAYFQQLQDKASLLKDDIEFYEKDKEQLAKELFDLKREQSALAENWDAYSQERKRLDWEKKRGRKL